MSKNFKLLYLSQILSQVTVNMMNFLLLARLFSATGSSIATSMLWVSYALPTVFFGPIGAALVDLVNRRKILIITNSLQALVIFLYIFMHEYSLFLLFAVVGIYSLLNQFYIPAESASLPSMVGRTKLPKANSLFFLAQQFSIVIGFGFAGLIETWVGFEGSLIICTALLAVAGVSVYFLPNMKTNKRLPKKFEALIKTFLDHILEGYKFIKSRKTVLYPLSLLFITQVGFSVVIANLPIIAKEVLHTSVSYVGLLVVIPAGIGATIGSILISKVLKKKWRKKKTIEISLAILGLAMSGLIFGKLSVTPLLVVLVGLGFVGVNIPTLTYLQEVTPEWLRGRVFGNLWFMITIVTILPIIFSGIISDFFGVKTLLTIFTLSVILILMYSLRNGQKLIEKYF